MKFKFSLEKLLQVKLQEEKQLFIFLGDCRQKLLKAEQKLKLFEQNYSTYDDELQRENTISVAKLQIYLQYLPILSDKIDEQKEQCKAIEKEIEKLLLQITNLIKERKTLETIKEKKFQEFMAEINNREQTQLDEMALNQYYLNDSWRR